MGFWGSIAKGAGMIAGTKPGIWYQKKKKPKGPTKTRLNVGGGTKEEEIAAAERDELEDIWRRQRKGQVDFKKGVGLLGGGRSKLT